MISAPIPQNEEERLKALQSYGLLDTAPESVYDDITHIASLICGAPITMVTLIDRNRQWFKSRIGQEDPETSRDVAFCAHAILEEDLFVVEDAARDERFHDNPLVTGDPHIRFYAGAPLQTRDGFSLGTLCVIDRVPRALTDVQSDCLRRLARQVVVHFEQRRKIAEQERFKAQLEEVVDLQNAIFNSANFSIIATEIDGTIRGFNAGAERMLGYRAEELVSKTSPRYFMMDRK